MSNPPKPLHVTPNPLHIVYWVMLTADEYRDASFMCSRGYLGDLIGHATTELWTDDDQTVTLGFTEPAAWEVMDEDDISPYDFWALTDTRTTLGAKVRAFLDNIV